MKEIKLAQEVIDLLETHDFNISEIHEQDGEYYVDIGQYTPEGEDWSECIWFDGTTAGFIEAVRKRTENFDVDEAVEVFIECRGKNGVPSSIRALVEDAEWKLEELETLADALSELDFEEDTEDEED
jgi:DNA-dependent RNA polymerase auxiliary subunit epsilon